MQKINVWSLLMATRRKPSTNPVYLVHIDLKIALPNLETRTNSAVTMFCHTRQTIIR